MYSSDNHEAHNTRAAGHLVATLHLLVNLASLIMLGNLCASASQDFGTRLTVLMNQGNELYEAYQHPLSLP